MPISTSCIDSCTTAQREAARILAPDLFEAIKRAAQTIANWSEGPKGLQSDNYVARCRETSRCSALEALSKAALGGDMAAVVAAADSEIDSGVDARQRKTVKQLVRQDLIPA